MWSVLDELLRAPLSLPEPESRQALASALLTPKLAASMTADRHLLALARRQKTKTPVESTIWGSVRDRLGRPETSWDGVTYGRSSLPNRPPGRINTRCALTRPWQMALFMAPHRWPRPHSPLVRQRVAQMVRDRAPQRPPSEPVLLLSLDSRQEPWVLGAQLRDHLGGEPPRISAKPRNEG